jgi:hypothetical protein
MSEEKKPELEKESIIGDVIDRLKPWLPGQPSEVIVTPAPVNPPAADAMTWFRWAVLVALAVFASWRSGWKEPINVPAPPVAQPQVVILSVPAGATIAEAKK